MARVTTAARGNNISLRISLLMTGTRLLLTPGKRSEAKEVGMTLEPDQYSSTSAGRLAAATWSAPAPPS